ncbi:MAG: hypothetical protein KF709_13430 [Gemmatimonadaceae bacterium]|nr:hypothetical protein [Gemmatimonadaceae bacterium]
MTLRSLAGWLGVLLLTACGGGTAASRALVTVFDSTRADTVVARTAGEVPAERVRQLVEELRIAPEADDTSLFADVFEFDVTPDGRLLVFDQGGRSVLEFAPGGALTRRIGRQGAGPGEFNRNGGMVARADGGFVQWDAGNGRVSFFSPSGNFDSSWVVPTGFSTSNGLRSDRSGSLYLYRPVTPPREGEILGRMGLVRLQPGGVWGDSLVPPDLPWERVVYVARVDGNTSSTSPTHSPRFQWQWHPDGHFVSVSTARYVLEVSRPDRALRIEREAPAIPVSADERAFEEERITASMRQTEPGWVFRGPPIPAEKPPVAALFVARDGRYWVRVATASELIPEAERDPVRPNRPPPRRYREQPEYEVFDADGSFRGRVALPMGSTFIEADGDLVWFIARDADGLAAVVRARVNPGLR